MCVCTKTKPLPVPLRTDSGKRRNPMKRFSMLFALITALLVSFSCAACKTSDDDDASSGSGQQPSYDTVSTYTVGSNTYTVSGSTVTDESNTKVGTVTADGAVSIEVNDGTTKITIESGNVVTLITITSDGTTTTQVTYKGTIAADGTGTLTNTANPNDTKSVSKETFETNGDVPAPPPAESPPSDYTTLTLTVPAGAKLVRLYGKSGENGFKQIFWRNFTDPSASAGTYSVKDYFADAGTEYTYRYRVQLDSADDASVYTAYSVTVTATAHKGQGALAATGTMEVDYNSETGVVTYRSVPTVANTLPDGNFTPRARIAVYNPAINYQWETNAAAVGSTMEHT